MNKRFGFNNCFGKKDNFELIQEILDKHYVCFFKYAYRCLNDKDRSHRLVNEAFSHAFIQQAALHSVGLIIDFLLTHISQGCNAFRMERLQDERIKELILINGKETYYEITKEVREAVHNEIEGLPWQRRRIFSLFFCGLSTRDIAEMVGRKEQTVRNEKIIAGNLVFKALQKRNLLLISNY